MNGVGVAVSILANFGRAGGFIADRDAGGSRLYHY